MPTPQDLQRLRGLLTQLRAISNVQRGELIRSEDWNSLVAALIDVAQAVLAADGAVTVPAHAHLDQVTSAWLSPQLREIFERGPLADPATQQRLLEFERTLKRLADQLDDSRNRVDEFRGRLTDLATRDIERESAVTNVRRAVENVSDPRPDLLNLRNTLASIQREMGNVLEASTRLTVNGQVVDLGNVVNRVGQLEQLRERLRLANGELLDAATVERRLSEAINRTVTHEQLDDAIRTRPAELSPETLEGIEGRLGTNIRNRVNESFAGFGTEIRDEVDTRLAGVGNIVDARLNDALPGVSQTLTTSLTASIQAARASAIEAALAGAGQTLSAREQAIRRDVDTRLADINTNVNATVRAQVAQQLPDQLAGVRSDLSAVSRKLDLVSAQATRHDEAIGQHSVALARIPQDQVTLRNELRQTMISEVEVRTAAAARSVEDRLTTLDRTQSDRFKNLSDDVRKLSADNAQRVATETASAQMRDLRSQLLAEMRTVARDEAGVIVRDRVKLAVDESVKEQFATVPGLIATEVRRRDVTPGRNIVLGPTITGGQK